MVENVPQQSAEQPPVDRDALWEAVTKPINERLAQDAAGLPASSTVDSGQPPDSPPAQEQPSGDQVPAEQQDFDPWQGLSDEQRSFFENQQQARNHAKAQYLSEKGRLAEAQRIEAEMKQRLAELEEFRANANKEKLAAPISMEDVPAVKAWVERYEGGEEDASLLLQMMQQVVDKRYEQAQQVDQSPSSPTEEQIRQMVDERVRTTATQSQHEIEMQKAMRDLNNSNSDFYRPGWQEVANSVEYRQWMAGLEPHEQQFAMQAVEAEDVAAILDTFSQETGHRFQGWPDPSAEPDNGQSQQPSYRDLQLAAAQQIPAGNSARSNLLPADGGIMSPDEVWNREKALANERLRRQY